MVLYSDISNSINTNQQIDYRKLMKKYIESTAIEIFDHQQYELFVNVDVNDFVVDLGCSMGYFYFKNKHKNINYIGIDGSIDCLKDFYENLGTDVNPILLNAFVNESKKTCLYKPFFHDQLLEKEVVCLSFFNLTKLFNRKIDFLKFDIEGDEINFLSDPINYNLFKKSINKFAGEFHLLNQNFSRNEINIFLKTFCSDKDLLIQIFSVDGINITESYWNSGDYYTEIIIAGKVNF